MKTTLHSLLILLLVFASNGYIHKGLAYKLMCVSAIQKQKSTIRMVAVQNDITITIPVPKVLNKVMENFPNSVKQVSSRVFKFFSSLRLQQRTIELANAMGTGGWMLISAILLLAFSERQDTKSEIESPFDHQYPVYDVKAAEKFYYKRPLLVLGRIFKILFLTTGFNIKLLFDWKFNKLEKNQKIRAKEALHILTHLGPTFIKLGQAMSMRTDLLPETYCNEMKQLQDSVPPFNSDLAREIICKDIGIRKIEEKFQVFSSQPVASASIGQVYKATLYDGREVAVKVQRPGILNDIGLDLFVMRLVAPMQVFMTNLINNSPTTSQDVQNGYKLVDEWGKGLVAEVDYRLEGKNTMQFIEAMEQRGLNAVTAPMVVHDLSGQKVLVTEWVTGTRLDKDCSADVPRLCGLAVNAYLTMLLDTGVLHCDPHPGNLLKTQDGKLCILDWGMTISLPRDLQYSLLEFVAHVKAEDYDQLPEDFVKLGATPPDQIEAVRKTGIAKGFEFIMKQMKKGGGPLKIMEALRAEFRTRYGGQLSDTELFLKVKDEVHKLRSSRDRDVKAWEEANGLAGLMEMISNQNRGVFSLPTYMLYVIRAFTTLEGIGLTVDPNYSIVQESYPYLAKRLLTDDSPRSRAALKSMIYQDGKLKTDKLIEFSEGFTNYTATTMDADRDGAGLRKAQQAFTDLLLDEKDNVMQEVFLDSAAKFTDSFVRVGLNQIKQSPGGQLLEYALKVPKTIVDTFVPNVMKPLLLPFTLPYDISKAIVNLVDKDDSDIANVQTMSLLWKNLEPQLRDQIRQLTRQALSTDTSPANILIPLSTLDSQTIRNRIGIANINQQIPVVLKLTRKFSASMLSQAAERLEASKKQTTQGSEANRNALAADGNEDVDFEVELLLTEQLSDITSSTVKSLANVLDDKQQRTKNS